MNERRCRALNGFRNRGVRPLLHGAASLPQPRRRRQAAAVTRRPRMLRAHGLIKKIPRSHRYQLTDSGHKIIAALLAARRADAATLAKAA